jgi:hypothetical protein
VMQLTIKQAYHRLLQHGEKEDSLMMRKLKLIIENSHPERVSDMQPMRKAFHTSAGDMATELGGIIRDLKYDSTKLIRSYERLQGLHRDLLIISGKTFFEERENQHSY